MVSQRNSDGYSPLHLALLLSQGKSKRRKAGGGGKTRKVPAVHGRIKGDPGTDCTGADVDCI